jgi:putative MATE family efflux protein
MHSKLFFKLLPVQILIVAMGAVNSLVDGTVAGRCIDSTKVGVVGLHFSFVNILSAIGAVLLGGTAVLCGRSMGSGDLKKTNALFSLNLILTFGCGVFFTLVSFLFSGTVADMLGASPELKPALIAYIIGYGVGIIPQMMAQQIASFLQMERQSKLGYAGIMAMIVTNIVLDILFVTVFGMGVMGLAVATSISNWVYLLILSSYFLTKRANLKFDRKNICWSDTIPMLKIGFPGAMLVFCIALRGMVLNRILLRYTGDDGLSAQAALTMICGIFIAFALGIGATLRVLASVAFGEEDKDSLKTLLKISFIKTLPLSLAVTVSMILLAAPISSMFFPDKSSTVYRYTYQLFVIYACCIPLIVVCQIVANYLQAGEHNLYVNILSVFDGFFAMVIPSFILAPYIGALGVWLANPIGIILTLLLSVGYACVFWRRIPKGTNEWMLIREDFGVADEDRLIMEIRSMADVTDTSSKVQRFCDDHDIDRKTAYYSALCLEEMAGNVVRHGFSADNKEHTAEARVVVLEDGVMVRLKDDCTPFDPMEMAGLLSDNEPEKNIGLRMIRRLAKDMTYQNLMGLNVLNIKM